MPSMRAADVRCARNALRGLLSLLLLCGCATWAAAHDPVIVDADVTVDDQGRITVVTHLRQVALLALIGSPRARLRDRAELDRDLPAFATMFSQTLEVVADGERLPLGGLQVAEDAGGAAPADPVALALTGTVPPHGQRLVLRFDPSGRLPRGTTVILGGTLTWHGQRIAPEPAASDGTVAWSLAVAGQTPPIAARWSDLPGFFRMGFMHIVPTGIDHILFVLGLFLLAPGLRPLLVQITAFTIAHSLTLGLAMAGIFELPSRIVEPLIALSIVAVAVENIFVRKLHPWRWAVVFLFGLVHGLGFAGALRELHLPSGGILMPLLGFNLGVEAGQLSIVAAATLLTVAWWRCAWYPRYVIVPASAVIAAIGLFWAVQRGLGFGIEA